MNNMFNLCISCHNLRGDYILTLPVPKTATFGLRIHFQYHAAKQREQLLPDSTHTSDFNI